MLVSVSVVTYNHVHFIKQCLDGILIQETSFPYEIILGEDGSSDGTREICIEYANKHPDKIRLFLRSRKDVIFINGNPTGRFNFTENLKSATGKYIALCEGDDYWTNENKLQMQVEFLEKNPSYSLCFTNVNHVSETGQVSNSAFFNLERDTFTHDDFAGILTPRTLTVVFRKETLPFEFPKEFSRVGNGDTFLFSIISEKGLVKFIDKVTGCYRKHEGGVHSRLSRTQQLWSRINTWTVMRDYFASKKVEKNCRKTISKAYAEILIGTLRERNFKLFFKTGYSAAKNDIRNFHFTILRLLLLIIMAGFKK